MLKSHIQRILQQNNLNPKETIAYLATAYTSTPYEQELRYLEALKLTSMLRDADLCCYSPIVHWHPVDRTFPAQYNCYLHQDLLMLRRHDILFIGLTKGIRESNGVAQEYSLAKAAGLPIYYLTIEGEIYDDYNPHFFRPLQQS